MSSGLYILAYGSGGVQEKWGCLTSSRIKNGLSPPARSRSMSKKIFVRCSVDVSFAGTSLVAEANVEQPFLKSRYNTYEDYARATMDDIFNEEQIADAYQADSRIFNTVYIENLGGGSFRLEPLPLEAQFAPVFGMLANDYNDDGKCDILITGNSYSSNVTDGQYDASIGLLLFGDGTGKFEPVLGRESGFFVNGDAKGMAELVLPDGRSLILVAQNSGKLKVFESGHSSDDMIKLRRDEVNATIHYENGDVEMREFYYGSGYLSNSSRVCKISKKVVSVDITSYSGKTRVLTF